MSEDVSAEELNDYLSRKGAVELLCEIEMDGSRFNELAEALDVSTTTLSKRLDEGEKVSLIQVLAVGGQRGAAHAYVLTERGLGMRHHMMDSGAVGAYQMLREAQEKFEDKADEIREWTAENSETLAEDPYERLEFHMNLQDAAEASDDEPADAE